MKSSTPFAGALVIDGHDSNDVSVKPLKGPLSLQLL